MKQKILLKTIQGIAIFIMLLLSCGTAVAEEDPLGCCEYLCEGGPSCQQLTADQCMASGGYWRPGWECCPTGPRCYDPCDDEPGCCGGYDCRGGTCRCAEGITESYCRNCMIFFRGDFRYCGGTWYRTGWCLGGPGGLCWHTEYPPTYTTTTIEGVICSTTTTTTIFCTDNADCNDNNSCTTDNCSLDTGNCSYTFKDCNDGNACTIDACNQGVCGHFPKECDDNDICTSDSCDSETGCVHEPFGCPALFQCGPGEQCCNCSCIGATETCETIITLSSFDANGIWGKVILKWSTESEIDNVGFNLYRSESKGGEYVQINDDLIQALGTQTEGSSYEFTDEDVQNRKTYWYKLEDIDTNGISTMHGPVSATPRLRYRDQQFVIREQ